MPMPTFGATVAKLQPIIVRVFDAFSEGVEIANRDHTDREYKRKDDPHHYAGIARRHVMEVLKRDGLLRLRAADDRPEHPMSALRVDYNEVALWMFKTPHPFDNLEPSVAERRKHHAVPLPGHSERKREFWSQASMLPGMQTDNILLIWSESGGELSPVITLARPVAGDHRRSTLQCQWAGHLRREMATLSVDDLTELEPAFEQTTLGMDGA